MSYTLQQFISDCQNALKDGASADNLEVVRGCVAKACGDDDFVNAYLGPDNNDPRKVLYQDDDLGFCILAHVHTGPKDSPPHDHGPSWAIYGQAAGETTMTEWRKVAEPSGDNPGKVEAVRSYTMKRGDAYAYAVGALHSPSRADETRLIRIEGMNMDGVKRDRYEVAA